MPTNIAENYLKHLYILQQQSEDNLVAMGKLAGVMSIAPGTATSMVKTLARDHLVYYRPRNGCTLTEKGEQIALDILRRHRIIELFLVQALGFDWSEIHDEAEVLEHAISHKVLERMDQFLGCPTLDPHGDPIPSANGEILQRNLDILSRCQTGAHVKIARILDQKKDFLLALEQHNLFPGHAIVVNNRDDYADTMTISVTGNSPITLGLTAAGKILVEPILKK